MADLTKKRQIAGAILSRCGLLEHKESILVAYGTDSIRDLTETQLDDLIAELNTVDRNRKNATAEIRKQRSIVLGLLDDMGVKPKSGNWDKVNEVLKNPRIAGKVLYMMTEEELKACAKRLRAMKGKLDAAIHAENEIAKNN